MKEPPVPCPERSGPQAKDHCDYLLDSIDAQLSQLQTWGPSAEIKDHRDSETASCNGPKGSSSPADLSVCSVDRNLNTSSEKDPVSLWEEYSWHLAHLLDLDGPAENQSQSDSVCTEDFADKFKEGLVTPLESSEEEEDVFASGILPCDFGLMECTARDQAENVGSSQLWGDPKTATDSSSMNAARQQPLGELERALSLGLKQSPSLVLQKARSLESLGGKISSFCKESSEGTTNTKRNSSTWDRILLPGPLDLEEKLVGFERGISGETAIVGPQQRRDGLGDSLEQLQDTHQNSNCPLLIQELSPDQPLHTAQGAAVRKTMLDLEASSRRVGQSCPIEGRCHCLSGTASLCPIKAPRNSLVLASPGEVRGGFISPWGLYPLIAFDTGKSQRSTPSRLRTGACRTNASGDSQQPPGLSREGSAKQTRTTNACAERHCEGPGLTTCCSTKKPCLLQRNLGRALGSSDADIGEEEEKEESELPRQSNSHRRWALRAKGLSGWKRSEGGAHSSCQGSSRAVRHGAGPLTEAFLADVVNLEGSIMKLQQDLILEEEKLLQKKSLIREADATLHKILREEKEFRATSELDRRTQQLEPRIVALQEILSEKELEMFRMHQVVSALEAEKEGWESAMENLKQEHKRQVAKLRGEAIQEKERELVQLQEEKQRLVQEVTEKTEQAKTEALRKQAAAFWKELENLHKTLQDRDAELVKERKAMQQQARKLKQDAKEMMQNLLLEEQKKWEADTKASLQMQRETLEEKCRKMQAKLQEALEKERRRCLAFQAKTDDLHKRIQELETQAQLLRGEKSTALKELRALLQEEKGQALSQLRKELEEERVQETRQMRASVRQREPDPRLLQAEQRGVSSCGQGNQTHTEWTEGSLAREVALACQQLQDLLPKQAGMSSLSRKLHGNSALPFPSQVLQALQEVREAIQQYLRELKQETESLKHSLLQVQREKEQQLKQQQEQLRLEGQWNLEALKDLMVQEHLADIAALQRSWVEKSMEETHALRKQLREKDKELRAIRRNVSCWTDERASKLSHKFRTKAEAELELCLAKDKSTGICRNPEATESETRFPCMD
ncbi:uncharacterized protein LOC143822528 isoform X2 [Paroedura picta]|uniref:uncharacterized protein LOC143822528 isoform X2 n=1 Tax=Paroedura picta TaxID=143630 RepID=UPI00405722A5